MNNLKLLAFSLLFSININSQEMHFNIEELSPSEEHSTYIGGSGLGPVFKHYLNEILFYCAANTCNPIQKNNITLNNNPILKMSAYSQVPSIEALIFKKVRDELLKRYNLCIQSSNTDSTATLYVRSISQAVPQMKNGGSSPNENGGFDLTNFPMPLFCWWFAFRGIIVKIEDIELLERKISLKVPAHIVEDATAKEEQIQTLLEANGIHCEIVKEPALMIVPKE